MNAKNVIGSLFICLFLASQAYAVDICVPEEQAKSIVVELKQKRVLEQEVQEYEKLIENLKKQNEILMEQNRLLKEQIEIYKNQKQLYDTELKDCEKKQHIGFFEKVKTFLMGAGTGAVVVLLLLH
jgi:predicted RNase H-like nuclease (RuvC/YqgF family)